MVSDIIVEGVSRGGCRGVSDIIVEGLVEGLVTS